MSCESELLRHVVSKRVLVISCVAVAILGLSICSYTTYAFVRLNHQAGGMTWAGNAPLVPYVIRRAGSDDIPDLSEETAIRQAFETWSQVQGSGIAFYEDQGPNRDRPSSDYTDNNIHMITFDESNTTGFFGSASSGLVAITPVEFVGTQIVDADVIFNGRDFKFSTPSASPGGATFDIQAVATHEIGHFLGLDHSPIWGSTMVPFTFSNSKTQRSLQRDDKAGAVSLYPIASGTGTISGQWSRNGSPIAAGHVVAIDQDGLPASSTLTHPDGSFAISGLPFGTYEVYIEPLDGPVSNDNMFQLTNPSLNFTTTFAGGNLSPATFFLAAGENLSVGSQEALPNPSGQKVNITSFNQGNMAVGNLGKTIVVSFGGVGLTNDKQLQIGNGHGDIEVSNAIFSTSQVTATLYVQPFAKPGLRSVIVRDAAGTNLGILTGGFEVTLPAPSVSGISPGEGAGSGGTEVTIDGQDFVEGCTVLFGDTPAQSVQFASPNRLLAITGAHSQGTVPVIVIHPNGQDASFSGYHYNDAGAPPAPTPTPAPPSNPSPPPAGNDGGGGGGGGGGGCAVQAPSPMPWAGLLMLAGLGLAARRRRCALQRG